MLGGPAEKRGPGPVGGRSAATRAPGPGREGPPPPRRGCRCAALQAGPLRRVSPSSPALPDVHQSEEPERRPGTSPSPPRRSTVGVRTGPRQPPQARASAVDRDGRCSVTPGPAAPPQPCVHLTPQPGHLGSPEPSPTPSSWALWDPPSVQRPAARPGPSLAATKQPPATPSEGSGEWGMGSRLTPCRSRAQSSQPLRPTSAIPAPGRA